MKPYGSGLTVVAALLSAAVLAGAAADSLPQSSPAAPTRAATACRHGIARITSMATAGGYTATTSTTCAFDVATVKGSCTVEFRGSDGASSTTSTVTTYNSVADVVDEARVVPPLMKALASTSTTVRGGQTSTGSETHSYDAQGRLTRSVGRSATGATSTTTFTAWDAAGRPTLARDVGPGFDNTRRISYDDVARTRTTVVGNGLVTTVETFDSNGNPTRQTAAGGPSRSTTVFTTIATELICK